MSENKGKLSSMELLAPAGSFSAFEAALEEGADAVYIGAPNLNARALSRDFTYPEIDALVRAAHNAGARVYIAMNSLVRENEIGTAIEGLAWFEKIQPDALIIQDLGLFGLARTYFPDLPLHASTLMSVHNSQAVNKLVDLGFKRVVLPRELTIEEVREIYDRTGAELEVFVHGAMCFSYSGLCLFSSMFGGKSSLRGQCVQPCRRKYAWQRKKGHVKQGKVTEKDGGYLFSMHDLCGIDFLPELKSAGVSCLKIEGRLKSAEYVRKTVRAYRLLLDDPDENGPGRAKKQEAYRYLDEAMGRKRSSGFFQGPQPLEAVTPALSGNIGQPVGKIVKLEESSGKGAKRERVMTVELGQDIRVGDRLRLHDERSGERTGFTLRTMKAGNRIVQQAAGGRKVQILLQGRELRSRKGPFKGSLFRVDVGAGRNDEQNARLRLIKNKRRSPGPDEQKIEYVLDIVASSDTGSRIRKAQRRRGGRLPFWVRIRSLRDRQFRLPVSPERYIVPLDRENVELLQSAPAKLRHYDQEIIWNLPPIIEEVSLPWFKKSVTRLFGEGFKAFQVGHFSQLGLFDELARGGDNLQLFGNYSCNVLNSIVLQVFREMHFAGVQFSLETDESNLESALTHFRSAAAHMPGNEKNPAVGMYVYGRPPLFTARLDDKRYKYGKRFVSPRGEVFVLERGDGITSVSPVSPFSLLDMRKEMEHCGIDYLVADLSVGNMKRNISEFALLLKRKTSEVDTLSGNFKTGLL